MAQAQTEPKLLLPFLQPFYDAVAPLSWLIIRVAVGWNLLMHGYPRFWRSRLHAAGFLVLGVDVYRDVCRHCAHSRAVYTDLCRGCRDRDAIHNRNVLGQWIPLAQARLRICAAVGPVVLCHRATWRRPVFARSQARARTVSALSGASWLTRLAPPCRIACFHDPPPLNTAGPLERFSPRGEVAEWLNAPHSKCGIRAAVSGVRIPPSPPVKLKSRINFQFSESYPQQPTHKAFCAAAAVVIVIDPIVSRRLGSSYRTGRSPHWVKVKNPKAPAV